MTTDAGRARVGATRCSPGCRATRWPRSPAARATSRSSRARCSWPRASRPTPSTCCGGGVWRIEVHSPGRGPIVIETVGPGAVVGWTWLVPALPLAVRRPGRRAGGGHRRRRRRACGRRRRPTRRFGYALMKRVRRGAARTPAGDPGPPARPLRARRCALTRPLWDRTQPPARCGPPDAAHDPRRPTGSSPPPRDRRRRRPFGSRRLEGRSDGLPAGQFNMLTAFGVGEAAISISSAPGRRGPARAHRPRRRAGDPRAVRRPGRRPGRGARTVRHRLGRRDGHRPARDVVVVAGGIGLAPLRGAVVELLDRQRQRPGADVVRARRRPRSPTRSSSPRTRGVGAGRAPTVARHGRRRRARAGRATSASSPRCSPTPPSTRPRPRRWSAARRS